MIKIIRRAWSFVRFGGRRPVTVNVLQVTGAKLTSENIRRAVEQQQRLIALQVQEELKKQDDPE